MDWQQTPCYLNGQWQPLAEARIPVLDRGFIFGDGVYEVIPVYARKPFRLAQHLARLERSLSEVRIRNPHTRAQWEALIAQLIAGSPAADQNVYIEITRGVAKRDFQFPAGVEPTVLAMTTPFTRPSAALREQGLRVVSYEDQRWLRCDVKSVSLLGAVLARQYATDHGCDEVLQFRNGFLTEGSSSNVWVVKDGAIHAPPRDNLILEGIRYGFMEELCAAEGIALHVRQLRPDEVAAADELMVTSALREVLPVVMLDGKPVGKGKPGPIYAQLRAAYDAAIAALGTAS